MCSQNSKVSLKKSSKCYCKPLLSCNSFQQGRSALICCCFSISRWCKVLKISYEQFLNLHNPITLTRRLKRETEMYKTILVLLTVSCPATPKSASLACPSVFSNIFPALISLCIFLIKCRYSSPFSVDCTIVAISSSVSWRREELLPAHQWLRQHYCALVCLLLRFTNCHLIAFTKGCHTSGGLVSDVQHYVAELDHKQHIHTYNISHTIVRSQLEILILQ